MGPARFVLMIVALALTACSAAHSPPVDAGPPPDAGPALMPADSVDLLIVKQNNARGALTAEALTGVGALVDALAPPDGPPCAALRDIHIGVVTSDLAASPGVLRGWPCSPPFDDGTLVRSVDFFTLDSERCNGAYPPFERFPAASRDELHHAVECKATDPDESGCGTHQLLEAALKSVATLSAGVAFLDGTTGHGEDANAGFVRERSFLAVLLVGPSDDCSLGVTGAAEGCAPPASEPTGYWPCCDANLAPIERYVDGFARLRPDGLHRFALVADVGLLPDWLPSNALDPLDYEAVLANPLFAEAGTFYTCGLFRVAAPRRFVRLARALGDHASLSSMCGDSRSQFARIGEFLVDRICRVSVP